MLPVAGEEGEGRAVARTVVRVEEVPLVVRVAGMRRRGRVVERSLPRRPLHCHPPQSQHPPPLAMLEAAVTPLPLARLVVVSIPLCHPHPHPRLLPPTPTPTPLHYAGGVADHCQLSEPTVHPGCPSPRACPAIGVPRTCRRLSLLQQQQGRGWLVWTPLCSRSLVGPLRFTSGDSVVRHVMREMHVLPRTRVVCGCFSAHACTLTYLHAVVVGSAAY